MKICGESLGAGRKAREESSAERGFSLSELLVVVATIGILANLAYPSVLEMTRRGLAARVAGDFQNVRTAAVEYMRDEHKYPPDGAAGSVPLGLSTYIRNKVSWTNSFPPVTYDWENWIAEDGSALHPDTGVLVGLSVISDDYKLLNEVERASGGRVQRLWSNRVTFVIQAVGSGSSGDSSGDGSGDGDGGDSGDGSGDGGGGDSGGGDSGGGGGDDTGGGDGDDSGKKKKEKKKKEKKKKGKKGKKRP